MHFCLTTVNHIFTKLNFNGATIQQMQYLQTVTVHIIKTTPKRIHYENSYSNVTCH